MKAALFWLFLILGWALLAIPPAVAESAPLRECSNCPDLAAIPGGSFLMGSPDEEHGRFDTEGPRHPVTLHAFALAKYDVTVAEFAVFVRETGYESGSCGWPKSSSWQSMLVMQPERQPVVCVSWRDAQAYIGWLNGKVGKGRNGPYRLPSEAEWEYAARAGTTTARWWGDAIGQGQANCNGCGSPWDDHQIAPVGTFPPNPFGLAEMLGNIWQWTDDCWNDSYQNAPANGAPWTSGDCSRRVLRGGSWSNLPDIIRSASRSSASADDRDADYASFTGFRLARSLP